jgi:hypothetical protein
MATILDPEEILQIHKQYADEFAQLAQGGINAAFSALSNSGIFRYNPARISIAFPKFGTPNSVGPLPDLPDAPTIDPLAQLKDLREIPNVSIPVLESFSQVIPSYSAPQVPGSAPVLLAQAPASPTAPVIPTAPAFISLPSLSLPYPTVDIPTAPVTTMPVFEGQRPNPISAPDPAVVVSQYTTARDAYRPQLATFVQGNADALVAHFVPEYDAVRSKINGVISNYAGGTGLPSTIEAAIYARNSDRNAQEFQRALSTAADTLGKNGFFMPGGALLSTLRQSRTAMGDAQVRGSTEIATKNLELEQSNFQFVVKIGAQLEEKMLDTVAKYVDLSLQLDIQAVNMAKEVLTAYLGAYNLQVMVYRAMWEGYTADAEVFKARISALDAQVRVYESAIRAELAKTEVNKNTVEVLTAAVNANRSMAEMYKYQVDAAIAPLEVAKVNATIYESRVRAYAAQVNGFDAEVNAYRGKVEGALGSFRAYEAQASAYAARASGYRAQVDGLIAPITATTDYNKAVSDSNNAKLREYSTKAEIAIKNFEGLVAGYTAESNAIVKQAEIEVEYWRTQSSLIFQEFNAALNQTFEFAREQMNLFRGQMEAAISAANGLAHAANVAGNLAGGAMSGLTSFAGTLVQAEQ